MALEAFAESKPLTLGIELELQLVNRHDYALVGAAEDLLRDVKRHKHKMDVKPETTMSVIEIATGICDSYTEALRQIDGNTRCSDQWCRPPQYRHLRGRHSCISALGRSQDIR